MHYPEAGGSKLFRNAAVCIPIYTAPYNRRPAWSANTGHIYFKRKIVVKPCRLKSCRISTWILRCSYHCLIYSTHIITDILNFYNIFHDATVPSGAGPSHCPSGAGPQWGRAPVGQGLLIVESSQSHSDTSQSLWLLWRSDQLNAETSTWQYTIHIREKHQCTWRDSNLKSQ
jgi:hypothetical protein